MTTRTYNTYYHSRCIYIYITFAYTRVRRHDTHTDTHTHSHTPIIFCLFVHSSIYSPDFLVWAMLLAAELNVYIFVVVFFFDVTHCVFGQQQQYQWKWIEIKCSMFFFLGLMPIGVYGLCWYVLFVKAKLMVISHLFFLLLFVRVSFEAVPHSIVIVFIFFALMHILPYILYIHLHAAHLYFFFLFLWHDDPFTIQTENIVWS